MIILYLLPAIGWGFMPIIAKMTNAKPINQLLGTTTVALLIGTLFTVIVQPSYNSGSFLAAVFLGVFGRLDNICNSIHFNYYQYLRLCRFPTGLN